MSGLESFKISRRFKYLLFLCKKFIFSSEDNLLNYYRKSIINSSANCKEMYFAVFKIYQILNFFNKEFWHICHYKKMYIFQVFYDFNNIVFEVE